MYKYILLLFLGCISCGKYDDDCIVITEQRPISNGYEENWYWTKFSNGLTIITKDKPDPAKFCKFNTVVNKE